ncbi:MAG: class I SAM-dependent methyltransferase, partial [Patescibacteria group bacterium]|nr:class I SAM-dependent methyltransferase [Patescibacteria group bacterium]
MERKYTKQQINDLRRVMDGNKEEMIPLLKYIRPKSQILNGLSRYLPAVFLKLKLDSKTVVLDLACGQGGVSIGLADKYGVNVVGYDIVPEYIQYAKELAMEKNVGHLCRFQIGDIRNIVKKKNICDVLLWFAPPRVFGKTKSTIKALRNSVKNNGFIVVGDAYLLPGVKAFGQFKNYENLKGTDKDFVFYGDVPDIA